MSEPKMEMEEVAMPEGLGLVIKFEGEMSNLNLDSDKIKDMLGDVLKKLKPKRYTLDKDMKPIPADDLPNKVWEKQMERFKVLHKTSLGRFAIISSFMGVHMQGVNPKEDENPRLFAVLVIKDGKISGVRKTRTVERCAENHKAAIAAIKEEFTRMPWTVVRDFMRNEYTLV